MHFVYNCIQSNLICQETKQKSFKNPIAKRENPKLFLNLALSGFLFYDIFIQECRGILAARCASCNCMTYFYCAPLQSCRRLYQLGD
ncbi:hypothetical protein DORFOR_01478 [Dorea formicigenerans ATCC 27755]|uniref:Uncharacterized protein n=1 Tax=Dorea formicigenerans ATCC 27755 TaxID=411461 RepID=B0G5D7_9FIRM|nr:hypothetical protein DORFOR_01478 [Dorea formicigenerans ATCC 27755]